MSSIEDAWSELLQRGDLAPEVATMIRSASVRPELRRLYPYMSLESRLRFSATSEYPFSEGYPYLQFVDPSRVFDGPAFELRDADNRVVRRGTLEDTIDGLLEVLPTGGAG